MEDRYIIGTVVYYESSLEARCNRLKSSYNIPFELSAKLFVRKTLLLYRTFVLTVPAVLSRISVLFLAKYTERTDFSMNKHRGSHYPDIVRVA